MEFNIEIRDEQCGENIIHRTSCLIVKGRIYPLGEFATFNSAFINAKELGHTNLNGCYWCCFWNHTFSVGVEII
jgi:hypothetical protein